MKCGTPDTAPQKRRKALAAVGFVAFSGFCPVAVPVFRNGFFVANPAAVPPLLV